MILIPCSNQIISLIWGRQRASWAGTMTAVGTPQMVAKNPKSLTGAYLCGKRSIAMPAKVRTASGHLTLAHATKHNLKDFTVQIPAWELCAAFQAFQVPVKVL